MKLTKFDKAIKAYNRVKELDKEIQELDSIAMRLADSNHLVDIDFKMKNLEYRKEEKVSFDEDGSLCRGETGRSMFSFGFLTFGAPTTAPKLEEGVASYKVAINEKVTLGLLGVLLSFKQAERTDLIKSLQKAGVQI